MKRGESHRKKKGNGYSYSWHYYASTIYLFPFLSKKFPDVTNGILTNRPISHLRKQVRDRKHLLFMETYIDPEYVMSSSLRGKVMSVRRFLRSGIRRTSRVSLTDIDSDTHDEHIARRKLNILRDRAQKGERVRLIDDNECIFTLEGVVGIHVGEFRPQQRRGEDHPSAYLTIPAKTWIDEQGKLLNNRF